MEPSLTVLAAIWGAVVGSFLNVVILRLPKEDASIAFPGSHCPHCKQPLTWRENIPIVSFLLLRGKCRTCRAPIALQYPMVEAAMAMLTVLLLQRFGLTFELLYYFLFCAALLVIIFIDIHHQIIPDRISLPGIVLGVIGSLIGNAITWQQSTLGVVLGGGVLYAVAWAYYMMTQREGMGGGDIKLLAMIGAFLGWQSLPYVIFASSLAGSLIGGIVMLKQRRGGQTRIPYGPFLALAALSYLFLQPQIGFLWQRYLNLSGF
jgi:leader peptidase (prepilin peptidase)/N-methyltransferase